jgi:hypothetical protein
MDSELKKKSLQAHQVGNQTQEPKKNSNKSIEVSSRTAAKAIARTLFAAQGSLLFPRSKLRPLPIPSSQLLQLAKIFLLFKSRQLQLDENEQTRSLSCLTIPQHLGLSPAKKKNLRSPSPTQQTQSKDQSFFCQTGFNHHARPPSRSTQSIQQRTDRTERNRANYQPPNNIWNDVRQKRQTTFESVPSGTIGSSLQSKTERFASFLF